MMDAQGERLCLAVLLLNSPMNCIHCV